MITKEVKPAPGRKVRRPDQQFKELPQEGALVEWSSYWERALTEGDVVLVDQEAPATAPKPSKTRSEE